MNHPVYLDPDQIKTAKLTGEAIETQDLLQLPTEEELLSRSEGYSCFIHLARGTVTPIKTTIFVAGFSPRCDLAIPQDQQAHTVSRFHATITEQNGIFYLKDESMNGTYFGTDPSDPKSFSRLPKGNDIQLKDGCYVRFADVLYLFRQGERRPQ